MDSQSFHVVPGRVITKILSESHKDVLNIVKETYLLHEHRNTINPDSYFLRFDDKPEARIIALPAAIKGGQALSGIKWIASYPRNIENNLQRASATLILNDYQNGYPIACLEASQISAVRTAASAVVAAGALSKGKKKASKVAFIGAGVIARTILEYFVNDDWLFESLSCYDLSQVDANRFAEFSESLDVNASAENSLEEAVEGASLVIFATTAATPYATSKELFSAGQVILNISLRDICPDIILNATNICDDIEHCMKANTSPHLAEQRVGHRGFVSGTIAQVIAGDISVDYSKPIIFSPFGLGVLDLAVAKLLYEDAVNSDNATLIPDFFADTKRW